ncbi:MAG: radical SAM family heme chaperone HemW [Kiloniellales bacterium]
MIAPVVRQEPLASTAPEPGFGLYVHWPFCLSKCPYCDFNSHVREAIDQARWRRTLLAELDHYAARTPGRRLTSIFFGGGTPSLMEAETVAAVIERAAAQWAFDPAIEITLEANPTSVEAARFAGYRAAGVNRVSLGVQALDDRALAFLGRQHSAAEALAAVALARRSFPRISFDLIYARPEQTGAAWTDELNRALDEAPTHLSVYQLTIEEGTAFHGAWRRGELVMPDEETSAALFDTTQERLAAAGLPAYEISNHAAPGSECRHNLTYWRYGDYVGIGPGAHGRLTLAGDKIATRQHRAPEAWLAEVERQGHATRGETIVASDERLIELTMMGLRLSEGIARDAFRRETGAEPEALFESARLDALQEAGYLELDEAGMRATPSGLGRLNALLAYMLEYKAAS